MSYNVTHKQFTLPTSLGNFTLSDTRIGATPVACLFELSRATTNGTVATHASYCRGACTASAQRASAIDARDNMPVTWSHRYSITNGCMTLIDPDSDQNVEFVVTFVSFQNNSVTLNIATNAPESAYKVNVAFFAGTEVSTNIQSFNIPSGVNTYNTVSGVGFEADLVFPCSIRGGDGTRWSQGTLSYGVVHNGATVKQFSIGRDSRNAAPDVEITGVISDSYGLAFTKQGTVWLAYAVEFASFTSTGFRTITRVLGGDVNDDHWFLAVKFGTSAKVFAGAIDLPTATGNKSYTGVGFKPDIVQIQASQGSAYDTLYLDGNVGGTLGTGTADADNETCSTISEEDGQPSGDTQSLVDSKILNFPQDNGASAYIATHSSMDNDGFTVNFTAVDTSAARKGWIWAIGNTGTPPPVGDWYNTSWKYRKKITVDSSKVAGTSHSNFAVLVNRTDSELRHTGSGGHVGKTNGGDILFTSSDKTTKIKHEVQLYTSTTGELIAWVKIPTLSGTANTDIYMYYGNAAASDQQDKVNTWDSNYELVYHMNNATSGGTGAVKDSTSNTNDGDSSDTSSGTGKIGDCLTFGTGDEVKVPNDSTLEPTSAITLSCWVKPTTTSGWRMFVTYPQVDGTHTSPYFRYGNFMNTGEDQGARINGVDLGVGSTKMINNAWNYLCLTWDGSESGTNDAKQYLDGLLKKTSSSGQTVLSYPNNNPVYLGRNGGDGEHFIGDMDEVRISSGVRSGDWITTEYNNQDSPSTFYSVASEEDAPTGKATILMNYYRIRRI